MFKENADFHLSGLPLEKQIAYTIENKMHLEIQHNDFNPKKYQNSNELVVDSIIGDKILAEDTNPKYSTFMNDAMMLNKLDYFPRTDPFHKLIWVLIVSFANFSQFILDLIEKLNIHLIVLNVHAENGTQHAITNALFRSKFYKLVKQVFNPKAKSRQFLGNKFLQVNQSINSAVTVNSAQSVTVANTANTAVNQPTTPISNSLHQHTLSSYLQQDKEAQQEIGFKWVNGAKIANNAIDGLNG